MIPSLQMFGMGRPIKRPGSGGGIANWFEVVTYTGNGAASQTVSTSMDLSNGGLVWVKRRNSTGNHRLVFKAASGATVYAFSTNNTTAASTPTDTLDNGSFTTTDNISGATYVAWVFKKSAGNFNIFTWTGNGVTGRTVAHGLGSTPKMLFTCPLTGTKLNYMQYQFLGGTQNMRLDSNATIGTSNQQWNDTAMDATNLTLGSSTLVNGNTVPFAGFAFGGADFEAGNFTGPGAAANVSMGFQPRYVALKRRDTTTGGWGLFDTIRTPTFTGNDAQFDGTTTAAEVTSTNFLDLIVGGVSVATGNYNGSASVSIWHAIR